MTRSATPARLVTKYTHMCVASCERLGASRITHTSCCCWAQDLVEDVKLVDEYEDAKNDRTSHCYRLMFRSMERNLVNEEIDKLQFALRDELENRGYNLR